MEVKRVPGHYADRFVYVEREGLSSDERHRDYLDQLEQHGKRLSLLADKITASGCAVSAETLIQAIRSAGH